MEKVEAMEEADLQWEWAGRLMLPAVMTDC